MTHRINDTMHASNPNARALRDWADQWAFPPRVNLEPFPREVIIDTTPPPPWFWGAVAAIAIGCVAAGVFVAALCGA